MSFCYCFAACQTLNLKRSPWFSVINIFSWTSQGHLFLCLFCPVSADPTLTPPIISPVSHSADRLGLSSDSEWSRSIWTTFWPPAVQWRRPDCCSVKQKDQSWNSVSAGEQMCYCMDFLWFTAEPDQNKPSTVTQKNLHKEHKQTWVLSECFHPGVLTVLVITDWFCFPVYLCDHVFKLSQWLVCWLSSFHCSSSSSSSAVASYSLLSFCARAHLSL